MYTWLGASASNALLLYGVACASALCLCTGFFTRLSALLLALASAQLAMVAPDADRGIDVLLRNALWVLACSGAGATWSIDARLRHGRWANDAVVLPGQGHGHGQVQNPALAFLALGTAV